MAGMSDPSRPPPRTTVTRTVYENRWMAVREDAFVRPDGSEGVYGVVEKTDFVVVIAMEDEAIWLVEQYRYPVGARFWELPQGSWQDRPDAEPIEVARGELREETGIEAGSLEHLGHLYQAYGFSTQGMDVFLATHLRHGPPAPEDEELDLVTRRFPLEAFETMLRSGEIKDGATLAAWALLGLRRALPAGSRPR